MADIEVTLGLNDKPFTNAIKGAESDVRKFGDTVEKELKSVSDSFGQIKTAIGGLALGSFITDLANSASEIVKISNSLGVSTASVKGWQQALVAAGGEADNVGDALIDLNQKLSESVNSGGDTLKAFEQLGISLTELQSISQEDLMKEVVKSLANVKDGAERSRLAMVLMGEDVNSVDWAQAASGIDKYTESAKQIEPSLKAAYAAQKEFNIQYETFKDQVTAAIPWEDLTAGLKLFGEAIPSIIALGESIVKLGTIIAGLMIINTATNAFHAYANALDAGGIAATALGLRFAKMAMWFREIPTYLLAAYEGMTLFARGAISATAAAEAFTLGLGSLAIVASRLAVIAGVIWGVNEAVSAFTDFDALHELGVATGFVDEKTQDLKNSTDEATKANEAHNQAIARKSKLLEDTKTALAGMVDSYSEENKATLDNIRNQTALIGITGDALKVKQAVIELEKEHAAKIKELNDKLKDPALSPEQQDIYRKGIEQVNSAYEQQIKDVTSLYEIQNKALEVDRMRQFADEQRIESTQRLRDLENERAKIGLPLIAQQYKDIEDAATAAITAQVEAETKARGLATPSDLPLEDVIKITEAVRKQIEVEKELTVSIEQATQAQNLQSFANQQYYESSQKIRDVYEEMAMSLMPELQRQQHQITLDAQKAAEQAIRAEEARRGEKLSTAEVQKYYDAAVAGTHDLMKATEQSYNMSRSWSTGWTKAMNRYVEDAGNAAKHAENIFTSAVNGMEDALVNFAQTGKFEWKNFLAMMLEELLRAQIQAVFAGMIGDMRGAMNNSYGNNQGGFGNYGGNQQNQSQGFWGSLGGVVSGIGDLFGFGDNKNTFKGNGPLLSYGNGYNDYFQGNGPLQSYGNDTSWWDSLTSGVSDFFGGWFANGGTLGAGKWGIAGENGPEIISGPANITPMDNFGQSATNVTYNINAVDAASFKQLLARDPAFLYGVSLQGAKMIPARR